MSKVKYGLSGLNPSELTVKGAHVFTKMSGNVNFPTPNPTLTELQTAVDDLIATTQAAVEGGTDRIAARDDKAFILTNVLRRMADYVQQASGGDALKIISAGYEVVQRGGPIGPMTKAGDLKAESSETMGAIDLSWKPVKGASDYIIEMSATDPNDQAQWQLVGYSHKASFSKEGLDSLKVYWFRVCALGTSGKGPYSDPARGVTK